MANLQFLTNDTINDRNISPFEIPSLGASLGIFSNGTGTLGCYLPNLKEVINN